MPIFFDNENQQVQVEFSGGDIIAGNCGEDEDNPECVGITEAPVSGKSGDIADDVDVSTPTVVLTFHTKQSLDSFITVLVEHRARKFKK